MSSTAVGSAQWKRFAIDSFGYKEEWLQFYGVHLEFEKMDNEKRFDDMMYELFGGEGGGDDLRVNMFYCTVLQFFFS